MITVIKYETNAEREQIIQEKTTQGLILIEVSNISEGDFLYFSDNPIPPKTPIEQQLDELKSKDAEIILTLVMNDLM